MILYKYLSADRIGVLRDRMIRFTQPGDFNDPFEFRPTIQQIAETPEVRNFVEQNFESLLEVELEKYGSILPFGIAQAKEPKQTRNGGGITAEQTRNKGGTIPAQPRNAGRNT